jgi:hypothetical protein
MNTGMVVLLFGGRPAPRALAKLPSVAIAGGIPDRGAVEGASRVAVVGTEADLAAVLTRLMRADLLDVEVAHVRGALSARRARTAAARRVPLVRDDTGTALVGSALWLPPAGSAGVRGEAVADDAVIFDGEVPGVRIEPTAAMPGVRAAVLGRWPRRWFAARAVQLGTTGAAVVRDGVPGARDVTRSTFYRHTTGWLRVSYPPPR